MPSGETGRKARQNKSVRHFLQSGLKAIIANLRPFCAISREIQADFSAPQTAWRRERDSNPRYLFKSVSPDVVVSYTPESS